MAEAAAPGEQPDPAEGADGAAEEEEDTTDAKPDRSARFLLFGRSELTLFNSIGFLYGHHTWQRCSF